MIKLVQQILYDIVKSDEVGIEVIGILSKHGYEWSARLKVNNTWEHIGSDTSKARMMKRFKYCYKQLQRQRLEAIEA